MNIAFYSGVSGMTAFQRSMDVLSHNIANVNTNGFKPQVLAFNDALYREMDINNEEPELVGHGVIPLGTDLMMMQGNPVATERMLDFCIMGDGFFRVEMPDGGMEFTRNGAFKISVEGNKAYLATDKGGYVLDDRGKRIELKRQVDQAGTVLKTYDQAEVASHVGIYQFPNPYGLQTVDGSSFLETANSGAASAVTRKQVGDDFDLKQKYLETSSVDVGKSMVDVIMAQRSFQFNARVVQTADQIEEIVNTLR